MSIITSLNKQATNLARKALRLGNDFVHPVSDDSGNTPDYNDPNSILSPDGHIELPHTAESVSYTHLTLPTNREV